MTINDIVKDPANRLLSYSKLVAKLNSENITFDKKALKSFYSNQEAEQIRRRPSKPKASFKITAPPNSFQLDVVFLPQYRSANNGIDKFLLLVDVQSRKVYAYPLIKNTAKAVLDAYEKFILERGQPPIAVTGDNQFNSSAFRTFNNNLGVNVYTDVAENEHISRYGNKLGVVDSCVRTLKRLIQKQVTLDDDPQWTEFLPAILKTYNSTPHEGINKQTPTSLEGDLQKQIDDHDRDWEYNHRLAGGSTFSLKAGDPVRILLAKGQFAKEGPRFSKSIYHIRARSGFRYLVDGSDRRFAPHELQKVSLAGLQKAIETPKRDQAIATHAQAQRLVRGAGLTPTEAFIQASKAQAKEPKDIGGRSKRTVHKPERFRDQTQSAVNKGIKVRNVD